MRLIQIDHNPSRRQLNVFGAIWLVFFGAIGGAVFYKGGSMAVAAAICAMAAAVPAAGWAVPAFMRAVYLGMAYASLPIGLVVSYLILAMVYYVVLTPISLVMRLFGHDPMNGRFDPEAETYWSPCEGNDGIESYFRQF